MIPAVLSAFLLALVWAVVVFLKLPLGIAIVVTLAVAAPWAAVLGWRRWKARKAAREIEKSLQSQADAQAQSARPDQQAEIESMQEEFGKAIDSLKRSKLARGGRNALAVLPWYMIIGPPGAGKSTAFRASGLKFPYLTKRGGVRGIGGTRNCEWWLTNQAVLLDTAGRYATEDEDHDEWMSFLDTLARARPRKPINGLLVAVSISELGAETEEGAAELGRRMRERVDEVMARLQVVLPVYVLFTKCDLLPGFVETFADLRKADRGQLWGFTLPVGEVSDAGELFQERFAELLGVLEERSLHRLGEERQLRARERIYEFPQQLEATRAPLAAFIESLFTENVYQDAPILRGVYFTSGTQEGRVIDRVMASMAEAFGVTPSLPEEEPVVEAKSYFLRDIFAQVLFPDQGLAFRSGKALKRDAVRRWAFVGAAGLVAALFLVFPLRSFLANRELVQSTGAIVDAVSGKLRASDGGLPPLAELEPLRERLALLERHREEGPPFSMRLGLYSGDALRPAVRRLYATAARRLIVDPAFRRQREEMGEFVRRLESSGAQPDEAEHARFYEKLKLHLLLTAPRELSEPALGDPEQQFVGRTVAEHWTGRWSASVDPAAPRLIEANARLFAKLLASDPTLALPRDEDLVRRERRVLGRLPLSDLAVEHLASGMDGKGYDLELGGLLEGPTVALRAAARVRGAFTRRAYEETIKARLGDPASLVELWVIAGSGKEGEDRAAREMELFRSRYYQRYIEEWQRFLESLSVQPIAALPLLQELTGGEPPIYGRLFAAVGYNTRLAILEGAVTKAGQGFLQKAQERVQTALGSASPGLPTPAALAARGEQARFGPLDVERHFAGLVGFGYAPDQPAATGGGAPPPRLPLDFYQEQLAFVRDALQAAQYGGEPGAAALREAVTKARTKVQWLIEAREVGWRPRLHSLLWPPIEAAMADTEDQASRVAAVKWCSSDLGLFYRRNLAARYPFARDSREDAALADVAEFFRRDSGRLWSFYNQALSGAVERRGDGFRFTRQQGAGAFRDELLPFLRRAQDITTVLFPPGAAEPAVAFSVQIQPTPRVAAVSLEVDGQRVEYHNEPEEWHRLHWPNPGKPAGASLRVRTADGNEETLERPGEWGLFRLLEMGTPRGEGRARDFTMVFKMQALGVAIAIDFRSARSETPFFGVRRSGPARFLEPFRGADTVPLDIAKRGAACADDAPSARR
jgi:type VI secretion system protein ImpL